MTMIILYGSAAYLLSIVLCSWLYKKCIEYCGKDEEQEHVEKYINVDKIAWITSWIPILNLWLSFCYAKEIYDNYAFKKMIKKVKKILERVSKDNPENEELKELINNL